jgi:hypothetical protein
MQIWYKNENPDLQLTVSLSPYLDVVFLKCDQARASCDY